MPVRRLALEVLVEVWEQCIDCSISDNSFVENSQTHFQALSHAASTRSGKSFGSVGTSRTILEILRARNWPRVPTIGRAAGTGTRAGRRSLNHPVITASACSAAFSKPPSKFTTGTQQVKRNCRWQRVLMWKLNQISSSLVQV